MSILASSAYKKAVARLMEASLRGDEEASKEAVAFLSQHLLGGSEPPSHCARPSAEFPHVNWNRRFKQLLQPAEQPRSVLLDMLSEESGSAAEHVSQCITELHRANFKSMYMKISRMASKDQQRTLDILRCVYASLKTRKPEELLDLVPVMARLVNPNDGSLDPLLVEAQQLPIAVDASECIKLHGNTRFHMIKDGELKDLLVTMLRDRPVAEWLPPIVATGCAASVHLVRNIVLHGVSTDGLLSALRPSLVANRGLYAQLCVYFLFQGDRCVDEFVSDHVRKHVEELVASPSPKRPSRAAQSAVKRRRVLREDDGEDEGDVPMRLPDEGDRSDDGGERQ